jgi:hypothetical protein
VVGEIKTREEALILLKEVPLQKVIMKNRYD